jgi:hypothetical protein
MVSGFGNAASDGDLILFPENVEAKTENFDQATAVLDGSHGNLRLGGMTADGDIGLFPKGAVNDPNNFKEATIHLNADRGQLFLGTQGQDGNLVIRNNNNDTTIFMNGDTGDISLRNADCAEEFDISDDAEPGCVLVTNGTDEGLRRSFKPYDTRAVGVVAGAGDYRPGLVLDRRETGKRRLPVALFGKTFCLVDASYGSVEAGDLLTTSETPGAAMCARDPHRALGAVVGKALKPLREGCDLVPILVSLQ